MSDAEPEEGEILSMELLLPVKALQDVGGSESPTSEEEIEEFVDHAMLWKCPDCGTLTLTEAESGPICPNCGHGVHVTVAVTNGRPAEHAAKLASELEDVEQLYEALQGDKWEKILDGTEFESQKEVNHLLKAISEEGNTDDE